MASTNKIGRNDPCWCGTGLKYKKCHLGREQENPVHSRTLRNSVQKEWGSRICMHPEANNDVCTQIIDAHTVQRSRTLEALVDSSKHALTFYRAEHDFSTLLKPKRIGWKNASTFTGFCHKHDSATFSPIENCALTSSPENAFLLTYRALCHEFFQKLSAEDASILSKKVADRGRPEEEQRDIQNYLNTHLAGVRKAVIDLTEIKALADKCLLARDYSAWQFIWLTFEGPLCFAASGAPTPTKDLNGNQLQTLHDKTTKIEHLYVSVVSDGVRPIVVLGWKKGHEAPNKLVQSLLKVERSDLPAFIVQYIFSHLENVYFSDAWWQELPESDKIAIQKLAAKSDSYYFPPRYAKTPSVPWTLLSTNFLNSNPIMQRAGQ